MPIFEFRCTECGNVFEMIFLNTEENADLKCPECHAETLERVVSRTSHVIARGSGEQPKITARSCGSGGSCLSLDIPGPTK